ncbi:MAG: hypothetical protein ACI81V_000249, partial [Lentimonas sp.]
LEFDAVAEDATGDLAVSIGGCRDADDGGNE